MKATSLIGDSKTSPSTETTEIRQSSSSAQVSVSADVVPDRRMNSRTDKTSVKSNKSDTSEVRQVSLYCLKVIESINSQVLYLQPRFRAYHKHETLDLFDGESCLCESM